jgi:hypothetical protein
VTEQHFNEQHFLRDFYQAVGEAPLEAGDPRYVNLYDGAGALLDDPVKVLTRAIRYSSGQSVQLLSGFKGTGKSTELRRLEAELEQEGYQVILVDVLDYLNAAMPIDVSDFLAVVAGGFGEKLAADEHLGRDLKQEGYWERLSAFFQRTSITLPDASAVGIKASLRTDPTFRQELQRKLAGHLGMLVADVRKFFEDGIKKLKARHGDATEVVLLVDSIEQIRGSYSNLAEVLRSVEVLFTRNAESLKIPHLHVVYTIPPYLKVFAPKLGALYGSGAIHVFPAVKVRELDGEVSLVGLEATKEIVRKRGDTRLLLGDRSEEVLGEIAINSGGSIRDLLRMVREIILRVERLPAGADVVEAALSQIRLESVPIADSDAVWLARIAESHEAALEDGEPRATLARFFDSALVLAYGRNPEWYDVHPLIRDLVRKQASARTRRAPLEA